MMKTKINYADINWFTFLLFVWQLPQALIGLSIYLVTRIEPIEYTNDHTGMTALWIPIDWGACWSLGPFVFAYPEATDDTLKHETGHSVQSLILGPLYLFVVAIPSVFLFWWRRGFKKSEEWYYDHYPENWANKLGGVTDIDRKE